MKQETRGDATLKEIVVVKELHGPNFIRNSTIITKEELDSKLTKIF